MTEIWQKIEEGAVIEHNIKNSPQTGDWRYMKPAVDKKLCAGCASCFDFCPEAAIDFDPAGRDKADIDYDICKGCGVCATVCPRKAIRMEKNQ